MSTTSTRPETPAVAGPAAEDEQPSFTHRQILAIMAALMLGMFLAALDQTIVSTSIRTIADDLNGLSYQAWVTTAYLITSTVSTPLYGKLSDIYGRKPFFLAAIIIFIVGSIACGALSQNIFQLAAFRALQGLGAGGLMTLALAIIGDVVSPRERARYQGYFIAVFGTSSVAGPIIGGLLAGTDQILWVSGWRWVFLVNVPIGVLALIVVAKVLNLHHVPRPHRIDWAGATALMVTVVPLLVVAEQGRAWGWGSTRSLVCYVLGVLGLVAFLAIERRAGDEALLPLRLFRIPTFSIASVLGFVIGMAMFGAMMTLPLYMQIVKGATPTESGLQLLPMVLGMMSGSVVAGQITSRTGKYKMFPILGTALLAVGLLLMSTVSWDTGYWSFAGFLLLVGLGLGLNMQTLTLAVQNAADRRDIGVATSSATFFRQMGGTLGTAVFLSLLFATVGDNIKNAFTAASATTEFQQAVRDPAVIGAPQNEVIRQLLSGGGTLSPDLLNNTSFINTLDLVFRKPFLIGFSDSITHVIFVASFAAMLAFVVAWFLPQLELKGASPADRKAARQAAQAEEAQTEQAQTEQARSEQAPPSDFAAAGYVAPAAVDEGESGRVRPGRAAAGDPVDDSVQAPRRALTIEDEDAEPEPVPRRSW